MYLTEIKRDWCSKKEPTLKTSSNKSNTEKMDEIKELSFIFLYLERH